MKNKQIPFYWRAEELELINYHRYTSHVTDEFIQLKTDEKDIHPNTHLWFQTLKKRVMDSHMDMGADGIRTQQWDNKVVIECKTSQGNTIFIGYYDWTMSIGLGVRSDSWIKPYPFIKK